MTRGQKILTWVLVLFAIFIALPVLLVALAPTLLSTGPARSLILSRVNRRVPGEITAGDWSLSWGKGISAEQITYTDEDTSVSIEHFELPVPLKTFFADGPKDLGTVTITRPEITIPVLHVPKRQKHKRRGKDQHEGTGEQQGDDTNISRGPSVTGASRYMPSGTRRSRTITAGLRVSDGSLTITGTDSQSLTVHDISVTADIGEAGESLDASMTFDDGGTVAFKGARGPGMAGLDASMKVTALELSQLEVLMDPSRGPARAAGTLQMVASVTEAEGKHHFGGSLEIDTLSLAGGELGDDEPELERVRLSLGGNGNYDSLTITNAVSESSLGRTRFSVALKRRDGRYVASGMQFTADIDAGAAGVQFRDTLSIPSRVGVAGGRFVADSKLATVDDRRQFYGSARLTDLGVTVDDRDLPHLSPVSLVVSAVESSGEFAVDRLQFDTPCVSFSSTGRLYNCDTAMDLQVGCKAVYDLDHTDAFMEAFTGEEFNVSGERVSEFDVDTPLRGKSWRQILMVFLTSAWD